jgi:uncharacterized protein YndB with AHSA1/START domain
MSPQNDLATESTAAAASDREIVFTRTFEAPRELVFKVWTDPRHVGAWWGPYGFTTTTSEMDVRPGGVWRYVMHGPDGTDYPNKIVYREVVRPERLTYWHGDDNDGEAGQSFEVEVRFDEQGGKTRLTMRMIFATAEERNLVVEKFGADEGGNQTLDRLREHLATIEAFEAGGQAFVLSRVFDAPRELVFRVWSEAEHLARWWGPVNCAVEVRSLEFRPGGIFHYSMRTPDGGEMWGRFLYREIVAPERIVFLSAFADETGNPVRADFSADWPIDTLSTLTLEDQGGRTKLTLRAIPYQATEAEHRAFEGMFDSMNQGWGGTLDQLADYLARV